MIPGSNLLKQAFSIISKSTVLYYKYNSRSLNDVGQEITLYDIPFELKGSLQAVPRDFYQQFGLDFTKTYFTFYAATNFLDIQRNVSGDQIEFNGKRYQCESAVDWFNIDRWDAVLCIMVDNTSPLMIKPGD